MLNRFARHVKIATAQLCARKQASTLAIRQAALMLLSSDIDAMIDMCKPPCCTVPTAHTILNKTQPHASHPQLFSFFRLSNRLSSAFDRSSPSPFFFAIVLASPPPTTSTHTLTHSLTHTTYRETFTITNQLLLVEFLLLTHQPRLLQLQGKKRHRHCFSRSGACRCARVPTSLPYPLLQLRGTTSISDGNRETCRTNQRHLL